MNKRRIFKIRNVFFVLSLFFCITMNAQDQRVTLSMTNASLEEVFKAIEKQSSYRFSYRSNLLSNQKGIKLSKSNATISSILDELLPTRNLAYKIVSDKMIVISENKNEKTTGVIKKITGTIMDDQGETIIGANVAIKGTTNGTVTDVDGNFSLDVAQGETLIVSYIGYSPKEVAVTNQSVYTISLAEDLLSIDEVVVVGYGTQRKKDITGSISSISTKDLSIQTVNNVQNLLQGRMAGVSVTSSGVAGDAPVIRVRGVGTLGNNNPLYVIDGFPTKSEIASQINPSNIESIQVLKDASSASIYGSQAANGVILITTKQGKEGKATIDVKVNAGVHLASNLPKMLNSQQYGDVLWNAMRNAGLTPQHSQYGNGPTPVIPDFIVPAGASASEVDLSKYNTAENQFMRANKAGTNWADEVYQAAPTTNIDISAQGGGPSSKYFLGANYYSQESLIKWAGYDRLTLRSNSQFNILNVATLGANMSGSYSTYKGATSDGKAILMAPLIPVRDVMGNWAGTKANGLGDSTNPVAKLYNQKDNYRNTLSALANAYLEIKLFKDLNFRTNAGANIEIADSKSFNPKTYWDKGDKNVLMNSLSIGNTKRIELVWNNTLTYTKTIANDHQITALLGTEAISNKYQSSSASRDDFISEELDYRYLSAGEKNKDNAESGVQYGLFSLFGRINYQYRDKYYLSAILRRDGSSRFGTNNKYGNFPGVSAAWRISEEAFMKKQDVVGDLKIRASYGKTGNQEIGDYAFASIYGTDIGTSSYPIIGNPNNLTQGISKESIGNSNIRWETTTQLNVGVDAALFNNQLMLNLDYYHKLTSDILQQVSYPATGGVASSPYENIGKMQNDGIELQANYVKTSTNPNKFGYELGLVLSGYRNNVTKLANNQFIQNTYNRTEVGRPIASFFGYVIEGIFQTQEEVDAHAAQTAKAVGRWKYRDVLKDGKIDANDRTYIGNPHPDFEFSLNGRFFYKNFDMNLFIQGTYGNDIAFVSKGGQESTDFFSDYFNKSTRILDTWTVDNRNAKLPEINLLNPNDEAGKVSSYLIEDGSYVRLKYLEIGYTIPPAILSKIHLKQTRVYLNVENLLTFTKYNNIDPEVRNGNDLSMGVDYINNMPIAKVFSVGFNVSF